MLEISRWIVYNLRIESIYYSFYIIKIKNIPWTAHKISTTTEEKSSISNSTMLILHRILIIPTYINNLLGTHLFKGTILSILNYTVPAIKANKYTPKIYLWQIRSTKIQFLLTNVVKEYREVLDPCTSTWETLVSIRLMLRPELKLLFIAVWSSLTLFSCFSSV